MHYTHTHTRTKTHVHTTHKHTHTHTDSTHSHTLKPSHMHVHVQCTCNTHNMYMPTCMHTIVNTVQHTLYSKQHMRSPPIPPPTQDDVESHLCGLHILQDLLSKYSPAFEDQFARLGLQLKIQALAGPPGTGAREDAPVVMEATAEGQGEGGESEKKGEGEGVKEGGGDDDVDGEEVEDATDLNVFTPYQWKEWSIVRSQDCLYMWNEFCSLELSNVSNGWFRFLVDNKLATMYSSGSTEGGPDSFGMYMYNVYTQIPRL